jgi:penicillin amidase
MLADWDGNLTAGSGPALLYACFQRALAAALYRRVLGDSLWDWIASGVLAPTVTVVRRWLANDTWELLGGPVAPSGGSGGALAGASSAAPDSAPGGATGDAPDGVSSGVSGDASGGERASLVLAALPGALAAAWTAAAGHGGPDPALWRWGDVHQAVRVHPLDGAGLDAGPAAGTAGTDGAAGPLPGVPMGGDADTIQAAGYGWRQGSPFTVTSLSVYRQVVDLADPDSAGYVIPGGSSGDPDSPHFADQLAQWARHRRIPMTRRSPG